MPGHNSTPHFHTTPRHAYVVSGTWWVSSSTHYNPKQMYPAPAGTYVTDVPKALELFFTGDFVDSAEALRIGLLNKVVDDEKLMEETYALAGRIANSPPIAARIIKRTIYQSLNTDLKTSLDLISSHMALVQLTEDSKEAIAAFKEKRPGKFKNQ